MATYQFTAPPSLTRKKSGLADISNLLKILGSMSTAGATGRAVARPKQPAAASLKQTQETINADLQSLFTTNAENYVGRDDKGNLILDKAAWENDALQYSKSSFALLPNAENYVPQAVNRIATGFNPILTEHINTQSADLEDRFFKYGNQLVSYTDQIKNLETAKATLAENKRTGDISPEQYLESVTRIDGLLPRLNNGILTNISNQTKISQEMDALNVYGSNIGFDNIFGLTEEDDAKEDNPKKQNIFKSYNGLSSALGVDNANLLMEKSFGSDTWQQFQESKYKVPGFDNMTNKIYAYKGNLQDSSSAYTKAQHDISDVSGIARAEHHIDFATTPQIADATMTDLGQGAEGRNMIAQLFSKEYISPKKKRKMDEKWDVKYPRTKSDEQLARIFGGKASEIFTDYTVEDTGLAEEEALLSNIPGLPTEDFKPDHFLKKMRNTRADDYKRSINLNESQRLLSQMVSDTSSTYFKATGKQLDPRTIKRQKELTGNFDKHKKTLMKMIRNQESRGSGDYGAKGEFGHMGAYQFDPRGVARNWKSMNDKLKRRGVKTINHQEAVFYDEQTGQVALTETGKHYFMNKSVAQDMMQDVYFDDYMQWSGDKALSPIDYAVYHFTGGKADWKSLKSGNLNLSFRGKGGETTTQQYNLYAPYKEDVNSIGNYIEKFIDEYNSIHR